MTTYPRASIPATEVRTIKSRYIRQEFRISVALPLSYPSKRSQRYPTVYLVDANWYFGMVTDLTRIMPVSGTFPECIVVGIGYPLDEPLQDMHNSVLALRLRDMSPVVDHEREQELARELKVDRLKSGGAKKFLHFIKSQVMPRVERDYRCDPSERVLAGHSLGGLFVLYALFQQPRLFKGYVAGSPSLWYGQDSGFKMEARYARTNRSLPVRLWLGAGGKEENPRTHVVSGMIRFAALLKSRGYKGLALTHQVIEGVDHPTFTGPTFSAGLQAVMGA